MTCDGTQLGTVWRLRETGENVDKLDINIVKFELLFDAFFECLNGG